MGRSTRSLVGSAEILLILGVGACAPPEQVGPGDTPVAVGDPRVEAIRKNLAMGLPQHVLVLLDEGRLLVDAPEALVEGSADRLARGQATAARSAAFLRGQTELWASIATTELRELRVLASLPILDVEIGGVAGLDALLAHPEVVGVFADTPHEMNLNESLGLVHQPVAAAGGATGSGTSVAILDTGLDYSRAAFGSCAQPGAPGCRVVYAADFASEDGALDAHGHGTNVAGIVAGVAPGAALIGLDVFVGGSGWSSDIIRAIDWCVAHRAEYDIAAMNLSLGSGLYSGTCTNDPFAAAIRTARAAGIVAAIASGNNGDKSRISSPACVPDAVSVGAVYDTNLGGVGWSSCQDNPANADTVTCFSNSAPFLSLLAPGALITAAGITMGGTSQATPHVAGAIAVLREVFPNASPEELIGRLQGTGTTVTDSRGGQSTPRIDVGNAVSGVCFFAPAATRVTFTDGAATGSVTLAAPVGCTWSAASSASWLTVAPASGTGTTSLSLTVSANRGAPRSATVTAGDRTITVQQGADTAAPAGSIIISGGASATRVTNVTLTLSATDTNMITGMCVSNTTSCATYEPFVTSKAWTLTSGAAGTRTVYLRLRDEWGNTSAVPSSDTITFDPTAPTGGVLSANASNATVTLSWRGFTDGGSGVASYVLVGAAGGPPLRCTGGPVLFAGSQTSFPHDGLNNGATYGYRVCAIDHAGNVSTGATASARPAPELVPPTGSVMINGGASLTGSTAVTVTLSATDTSGVTQMCISNNTTCSTFVAYAPSKPWTLASGAAGLRRVSAWFRDTYGNTTTGAVSASILLDNAAPTQGSVLVTPASGRVTLGWAGFADPLSGISRYVVVTGASMPTSCATGTVLFNALATTFTHSGLVNGTSYNYRVCAVDAVGNQSAGIGAIGRPAPELVAPTGSITIAGGAAMTGPSPVTLTIQGSDPSGVAAMCISNSTTCTAFVPFATSVAWTLAAGSGYISTVRLWLRDSYGNTSAAPFFDTIVLDSTAPAGGQLTVSAAPTSVSLSWGGFVDAQSGVVRYVVTATPARLPASCSTGTVVYDGAALSASHTGLSPGSTWGYRVCAIDGMGNRNAKLGKVVLLPSSPPL